MSKGQQDVELLTTLTNKDTSKFTLIIDRLRKEARDIADELLQVNNEEAVSQAMDKASDWLGSNAPFQVTRPMAYVKRLVHNEVITYWRAHKEDEALSEGQLKHILIWVEGNSWDDEENFWEIAENSGWHHVVNPKKYKPSEEEYPEHHWLRRLDSLRDYAEWLKLSGVLDYLRSKHQMSEGELTRQRLRALARKEGHTLAKSLRDRQWRQYKLTMTLIDNIPSLREQEVVKLYLWGFCVTSIANRLNVKKPYISRVVTKWLKDWGWDKHKRDEIRFIFLTYHLARSYSKLFDAITAPIRKRQERQRESKRRERREHPEHDLLFLLECDLDSYYGVSIPDSWRSKGVSWLTARLVSIRRHLLGLTQEKAVEAISKEITELERSVRYEEREEIEREMRLNSPKFNMLVDKLWDKVRKSPETSFYFSDLKKVDDLALREVCARCYFRWYSSSSSPLIS